jgi:hypothetical protein
VTSDNAFGGSRVQECAAAHPFALGCADVFIGRRSAVDGRCLRQRIPVALERPVDTMRGAFLQHELRQDLLPQIELFNPRDNGGALDVIRSGPADVEVELYRGVVEIRIAWLRFSWHGN